MTLTLREFVDMQLEVEEGEDANEAAKATLAGVLALLRSAHQREIATNEGVAASFLAWVEENGEPTIEKVRDWTYNLKKAIDFPIPMDYILEVMGSD